MLRDLPDTTAAKLLAELPPEMRQRVRREVAGLEDVDPLEQRRAVESFTASLRQSAAQPVEKHASSLDFLSEISDDGLLNLLRDEHPQTKAVVLAEIPPARAAAILPRLGTAQRQDLLARIGRLPDVPEEMLSELARSFRTRLDRLTADHHDRSTHRFAGRSRSGDVYDAMASADISLDSPAPVSSRLQAILAEMPAASPTTHATYRSVERSEPSDARMDRSPREQAVKADPRAASLSVEQTHQELMRLSPAKLCETLGRVDTRTAILALCGLPSHVADAAIACLPRSQANQVRQHLMSVGSLEIREIDQAKASVAAAGRVAGQSPHDAGATNIAAAARAASSHGHGPIAVAM